MEDAVERLRALFREVYQQPVDAVEITLSSAGDDPLVAPAFARVTRLRLTLLRRTFTDLGLDEEEAHNRAWLAYAFYIRHHQLGREAETRAGAPRRLDRVVNLLVRDPA